VNKLTISREQKRNSENKYYSAESIQIKSSTRDKFKTRNKKLTNKLKLKIDKIPKEVVSIKKRTNEYQPKSKNSRR